DQAKLLLSLHFLEGTELEPVNSNGDGGGSETEFCLQTLSPRLTAPWQCPGTTKEISPPIRLLQSFRIDPGGGRGPESEPSPLRCLPEVTLVRRQAVDKRLPRPELPQAPDRIMLAPFSAIMIVGALVLAPTSRGMIEASITRMPSSPRIFRAGSTTAASSWPIL